MGMWFNSRSLTPPLQTLGAFGSYNLVVFLVVICQIFYDHVEVSRELESLVLIVLALSKVNGFLAIGKRTILRVGFQRVFVALYGYLMVFSAL